MNDNISLLWLNSDDWNLPIVSYLALKNMPG